MKLNDAMTRRRFLRDAAWFGATAVVAGGSLPGFARAQSASMSPDLAVAKGIDPARNALAAIDALGGFSRFVRPGQTVAIKPNPIGRARPEMGLNTHPAIIEAVVRGCVAAGAAKVTVFSRDDRGSMDVNGTSDAVKNGGGELVIPDGPDDYREILVPRGRVLRREMIATALLDADLFINLPVAKHHAGTEFTGAMKNLMGVNQNALFYHQTDLHQCIAEVASAVRPQLIVVDASHVLLTNGPVGPGKVIHPQTVIAGVDPVAADAFAARAYFKDPGSVRHIRMAYDLVVGEIDLARLRIHEFEV